MYNNGDFKDNYEKAYILLPIESDEAYEEENLNECCELLRTAGAFTVGHTSQRIREINPATYMGIGKISEAASKVEELGVELVLFNGELSPAQVNNISEMMKGVKVIDRTALILDIFALHATTNEGKLQVELAQLEYLYPRLKGLGKSLSRLGGGIGTRGPGETQLETDKRHIRNRIRTIRSTLCEISERRKLQSERREKNSASVVAITGYTNAGKSTLLNLLSGSEVLAEDKLFATLDPTARKVDIGGLKVIFIDTVGFIKDIPTGLVEAFKSTLESAANADIILNVCDASGDHERNLAVSEEILRGLHCDAPIIKVYNKCDKIKDFSDFPKDACFISALNNKGVDELKKRLIDAFKDIYTEVEIKIPYTSLNKFYGLQDYAEKYDIEYSDDGVSIKIKTKKIFRTKFLRL